jgi:hypothetical protein
VLGMRPWPRLSVTPALLLSLLSPLPLLTKQSCCCDGPGELVGPVQVVSLDVADQSAVLDLVCTKDEHRRQVSVPRFQLQVVFFALSDKCKVDVVFVSEFLSLCAVPVDPPQYITTSMLFVNCSRFA